MNVYREALEYTKYGSGMGLCYFIQKANGNFNTTIEYDEDEDIQMMKFFFQNTDDSVNWFDHKLYENGKYEYREARIHALDKMADIYDKEFK